MPCFTGHTPMETRNGLVVQAEPTRADRQGERKAALETIDRHSPGSTPRLTSGADRGYDSASCVAEPGRTVVTPHIAPERGHSGIDGRTAQHPGYAASQQGRQKIEPPGLDQGHRRHGPDRSPRPRQGPRGVHEDTGTLQSRSAPETPGGLTKGAARTRGPLPAGSAFDP